MEANRSIPVLNLTNLSTNTTRPDQKITPLGRLSGYHAIMMNYNQTLTECNLGDEEISQSVKNLRESCNAIEKYLAKGPLAEINDLQDSLDYKNEINIYNNQKANLEKAKWVFKEYAKIIAALADHYEASHSPSQLLPTNIDERKNALDRLTASIDHDPQPGLSLCNSTAVFTLASLIVAISAIAMYFLFISSKNR